MAKQSTARGEYELIPDGKRDKTVLSDHEQEISLAPLKSRASEAQRNTPPNPMEDYNPLRIFNATKYMVVPLFLCIGVATVIIIGLVIGGILTYITAFIIFAAFNIVGGILGALMVYYFGTISQLLNVLDLENKWYESGIERLATTRKSVAKEARKVYFQMDILKATGKDLEEQYKQFERLREELQIICKDNEEVKGTLNEVNGVCQDIFLAIKLNERAHLLSIYYDLMTRDSSKEGKHALTRKKYKSLMMRLKADTRREIEKRGGFDAMDRNNDGQVDVQEFIALIDDILEITEEQETMTLRKLQQLNYK